MYAWVYAALLVGWIGADRGWFLSATGGFELGSTDLFCMASCSLQRILII
jgi:hypothetical protein